ncbi:protein of unknown function [Streptosporangium canum]|uniref:DUF4190 domain-containing protein n=1 Tax=Streptosporangium canum TaxID=324952 RepID=A0A1I4DLP7_9ACTN|nr:DUF4190 domain-containing protein [Streptosporangium canum]SFK92831.1 protein of unknown function [Streptosporangium canum]
MSYPPNYGQQDPYQQQGYGQPYGYAPQQPSPTKTNGLAVASLVLGLTGFITCGFTSLLAIVFGHVSLGQIKRDRTDGHGMALAGVVLGWILTSLWILYWVLVMAGAIAGVGTTALSTPTSDSSSSAVQGSGKHTVVFEAIGSDGATSALNITGSANYRITQDNGVPLPYRKELKVDELRHFYFWVQNASDKGTVTCRIIIDGKVAREETEDGPYGVCRVTADTP